MKGLNRRARVAILSIGAVVLAAFLLATFVRPIQEQDNPVIATVNGEPIEMNEFSHMMDEEMSGVYQYFYEKYGVTEQTNFWHNRFGGESPTEKLKSETLKALISRKVQEEIAKREGVKKETSYTAFLQDLEHENQQRKEALERNEPVFGPVSYDLRTYYRISFSNMVQAIKDKMLKESPPLESDVESFYYKMKDTLFQNIGSVQIEYIRIPVEEADGLLSLQEIQQDLENGLSFKRLAAEHELEFEYGLKTLDRSSLNEDLASYPNIQRELQSMKVGDVSSVISERLYHYVIRCLEKETPTYKSMNEVMDRLNEKIIDQRYEALVNESEAQAIVIIHDKVYQSVAVQPQ